MSLFEVVGQEEFESLFTFRSKKYLPLYDAVRALKFETQVKCVKVKVNGAPVQMMQKIVARYSKNQGVKVQTVQPRPPNGFLYIYKKGRSV